MGEEIYHIIEKQIGSKIVRRTGVGGGCISNAERITLKNDQSFFLKSGSPTQMYHCEASGLQELAKANVIRVPQVFLAEESFILMEDIRSGAKKNHFFESFGRKFAQLHQYHSESFGFYEDNFIGSTPQKNITRDEEAINWTSFFMNNRLLFQFRLAEQNGYATDKLRRGFHLLEEKIEDILKGSEEKPSLLHGDLWGGNYLCDESGEPVLIDPAVFYGHREADLAMTRLFGGFSPEFYQAYQEEYPLPEGASDRENLYMLYHVMNHLNLFGPGYYAQTERLLWGYL
jgi:fructosamine-3-kinase